MAQDPNKIASASVSITVGLSTLLGLLFGWRVGLGTVAAMLFWSGLVTLQAESRKAP